MRAMSSNRLAAARQQRLRRPSRSSEKSASGRSMENVTVRAPRLPRDRPRIAATSGSSAFSTTVAAWAKIRDLARAYAATDG